MLHKMNRGTHTHTHAESPEGGAALSPEGLGEGSPTEGIMYKLGLQTRAVRPGRRKPLRSESSMPQNRDARMATLFEECRRSAGLEFRMYSDVWPGRRLATLGPEQTDLWAMLRSLNFYGKPSRQRRDKGLHLKARSGSTEEHDMKAGGNFPGNYFKGPAQWFSTTVT